MKEFDKLNELFYEWWNDEHGLFLERGATTPKEWKTKDMRCYFHTKLLKEARQEFWLFK